jgi:GntR family transcriptional regulator/MocR family aminotransferase
MLDNKNDSLPLYRQIYEAIQKGILSGKFVAKMQLPSTRFLAQNLGVSRITIVNAYEQLFAEGYLEGKTGAGTFVASELPENLLQIKAVKENSKKSPELPLRLSDYGEKISNKNVSTVRCLVQSTFRPFQNGLTAVDEFPFEIWSRIAAKYYKNPPRKLLGYGDPQGFAPFREAVAAHLKSARGVNCSAENIIITSGAQQALDLTARIFLSSKDSVLIENPCYIEAKSLFAATGANVIPVEIDEEGFDAAKIPNSGKNAKLVYVTPSHQYPLGVTMSLARRLALLEWAKNQNAWIIEDDYNSEYRYAGRPLASMQGLDKTGRVIYIGTFSKTIFPSLRLGCAVVPPELVEIFTTSRALTDVHSSLAEQTILAEFIAEGHFSRHLRRMRKLYEQRQQILIENCEKHLKDFLQIEKNDAGMHLVGWLSEDFSDKEIAKKALGNNLKLAAVSDYFVDKKSSRNGLILGFTAFDEKQIIEGVTNLKQILTDTK